MNPESNILTLMNVVDVPDTTNYWFVRTNAGDYYEDFILHDYIAIAWDAVTLDVLNKNSEDSIKRIIKTSDKSYPTNIDIFDLEAKEKAAITTIYNKLHRFVFGLSIGDIVLVPSKDSNQITIAEIISDAYEDPSYRERYLIENPNTEIIPCPYHKRRKIKTLKTLSKNEIDIYLLKGIASQHALSDMNLYSSFINRSLYGIYTRENKIHSTIHAGHPKGLTLKELARFTTLLNTMAEDIAEQYDLAFDTNDIEVKLNIHSPGIIELISAISTGGLVVGSITFALNNLINGGKFKLSYRNENQRIDFSIESETKGIKGNKQADRELDIKEREQLTEMIKELDIKSPDIISSVINKREITTDMIKQSMTNQDKSPSNPK